MNRAQRRRLDKGKTNTKRPTYNLTMEQIKFAAQQAYQKEKDDNFMESVNQAMILMFTLPCDVLIDAGWEKQDIENFMADMLDRYTAWINGDFDLDKARDRLWEYGGLRLEESEVNG